MRPDETWKAHHYYIHFIMVKNFSFKVLHNVSSCSNVKVEIYDPASCTKWRRSVTSQPRLLFHQVQFGSLILNSISFFRVLMFSLNKLLGRNELYQTLLELEHACWGWSHARSSCLDRCVYKTVVGTVNKSTTSSRRPLWIDKASKGKRCGSLSKLTVLHRTCAEFYLSLCCFWSLYILCMGNYWYVLEGSGERRGCIGQSSTRWRLVTCHRVSKNDQHECGTFAPGTKMRLQRTQGLVPPSTESINQPYMWPALWQ